MKQLVQGKVKNQTISMDGKSIRSTGKLPSSVSIMHIASAVISESRFIIGSTECDRKTGEIDAVRYLIKLLYIKYVFVVEDALHCQLETAEVIIQAKDDYLLIVKDNQKHLKESVDLLSFNQNRDSYVTVEKNASRIE